MILPALLTAVTMVAVAMAAGMGKQYLVFSLPMILVSAVASVASFLWQKRANARKNLEREQGYKALLETYDRRLQTLQVEQHHVLIQKFPTAEECVARAARAERNLWARSPDDPDFLELNLGFGRRLSSVTVKVPPPVNPVKPDELSKAASALAERIPLSAGSADHVAATPGRRRRHCRPRGATSSTRRAHSLSRPQTHHSPDEVKIVAIYSPDQEKELGMAALAPPCLERQSSFSLPCADQGICTRPGDLDQRVPESSQVRGQGELNPRRGQDSHLFHLPCRRYCCARLIRDEPLLQRLG